MTGQTLDIVRVAAVVALGLTLRVVEDGQTGHVVADLSGGQTVQVGPAVLPAVAVAPLQAGTETRSLRLNTERESVSGLVSSESLTAHLRLDIIVSLVLQWNVYSDGTTSYSYLNSIFINLSCLSSTHNLYHTSLKSHLEN